MAVDDLDFCHLVNPEQSVLKADYQQFLLSLDGPTIIDIKQNPNSDWIAVTTLLHGNEPSGLIALHRWLTEKDKLPNTGINVRIIVCSVEAATHGTLFTHRTLPNGADINRCFNTEINNVYHQRANKIRKLIEAVSPVAVLDLHNTSGSGPAFAVSTIVTPDTLALASYFTDTLILSDIKLGALMEVDFGCPVITVECGGRLEEQSHEIAYKGITSLCSLSDFSNIHEYKKVNVICQPLRLEITESTKLSFNIHDEGEEGVTMLSNIEQFNFGPIGAEQLIGWTDDKGLGNLSIRDKTGKNKITQFFKLRGNQLVNKVPLRIFMATSDTSIAKSDCLLYLAPH